MLPGVPDDRVLTDRSMPGAEWFPGTSVNFAEQALRWAAEGTPTRRWSSLDETTMTGGGEPVEISWAQLRGQVGAFAATLRRLGVQRGDRVAGYLPNVPEAVVAFLGAASIGAVWAACAPDFGTRAVLDRFAQIEPTVLVAVDGYRFNGREHDRRDVVAELRAAPAHRADDDRGPPAAPGRGARRRARAGRTPWPTSRSRSSSSCRSTTRCGSSTRRGPRACPRGSCTGTAASCWRPASTRRCTSTSAPATGCSGTPRPPGSCGTSPPAACSRA